MKENIIIHNLSSLSLGFHKYRIIQLKNKFFIWELKFINLIHRQHEIEVF